MRLKPLQVLITLPLAFLLLGCSTSKPSSASSHANATSPSPLRTAYWYYELGRLDLAEKQIQTVLQAQPDAPAALHLLGMVREREHRRQIGEEPAWGYYQTILQQPIYR
jgi:Tfp pilus assembly protein PilF